MPSERIQRQIDRLRDAAESALEQNDWTALRTTSRIPSIRRQRRSGEPSCKGRTQ